MKKKRFGGIRFSTIFCVLFLIAIGGYMLYSNIALNEVSNELLEAKEDLTRLEGEATSLQVSINAKAQMDEVERIATEELGMVKIENYQIQTINLDTEDSVEIIKDEKSDSGWWDGVVAEFNILLEYLN